MLQDLVVGTRVQISVVVKRVDLVAIQDATEYFVISLYDNGFWCLVANLNCHVEEIDED
jgi:hypothetical protein